MPDFPK